MAEAGGELLLASGGGGSLPGVVVVVGEGDEQEVLARARRRQARRGGARARGAPLPQQLLVRGRARLAELVHEGEDALHCRLDVAHAPR